MNKILEETLANEKPDSTFEQRMLSGFRSRIPQRSGLVKLLGDLMRLRATQITAVAAVLLGLVQIGRMITGEGAALPRNREYVGREEFAARPRQASQALTDELSTLRKSKSGRDKGIAAEKPESSLDSAAGQDAAAPAAKFPLNLKMRDRGAEGAEFVTESSIPTAEDRGDLTARSASSGTDKSQTHPQCGGRTGDRELWRRGAENHGVRERRARLCGDFKL